jgi:glucose/arabinose dehydrogenase
MSCALLASVLAALVFPASDARGAATVPANFAHSRVVGGLVNPTAMDFAPDGRLFLAEQRGVLRVLKADGTLTTFLDISDKVDSTGERGLLGVAFDPAFPDNQYVYLYYTREATATNPAHNRVVRVTAGGNGAVGDNADGDNAQSLSTLKGKMLRINKDGTIPPGNPFYERAAGINRAIWALGFRNPFSFAVQPQTGKMFVNDVGQSTWEEIDRGAASANYGWSRYEGPESDPAYRDPAFAYGHGSTSTTGCAITGGTFYDPPTGQFPSGYVGDYFFADLCSGWIRRLDGATGDVSGFATGISRPVDLEVSKGGSLYYLSRGDVEGSVERIRYTGA